MRENNKTKTALRGALYTFGLSSNAPHLRLFIQNIASRNFNAMEKNVQNNQVAYHLAADTKANKEGLVKIYIRFYKGRIKKDYFTGVRWPADKFDKAQQILLPRHKNDIDHQPNTLILDQKKTTLHKLALSSYLKGIELTIEDYLQALDKRTLSLDFVNFMSQNINHQYNKNIIVYDTWRRHRSSLNKFVEYWGEPNISIHEITLSKIQEFDGYWRARNKANNTVAGYHKDIKNYLSKAVFNGYIESSPYEHFKFKYVDGDREALNQDEVKILYKLLNTDLLSDNESEVLRRFLFSCMTGIRISDTHRVKSEMIMDNVLVFKPTKGLKYGKILRIPLPSIALSLIQDRAGLLFKPLSSQYINRCLKLIAHYAGIKKRLSYHCARDTFGTIFIELGGDIKSCSDLMGHSSTKVTSIYIKMADKRKTTLMSNFDSIFQ
ncbi:phage integrase SAM-like domain-containing protein [Sphingobacterium spiritivorum]|uniref:phage integrase SAM-like domain-containing protein n=1 Tax=Sphingobacterium spiritivorum TaxID=258 RepID=UPI003DA55F44